MLKRLLWFILSIIVAVSLFFLLIMIIPIKTQTLEKVELTYIFIDDDWTEYDIFEPVHWAAKDWSFLFRPRTWDKQTILSWENIKKLEKIIFYKVLYLKKILMNKILVVKM